MVSNPLINTDIQHIMENTSLNFVLLWLGLFVEIPLRIVEISIYSTEYTKDTHKAGNSILCVGTGNHFSVVRKKLAASEKLR